MKLLAVAAAVAGLALSSAAGAADISGLFNTGTDATNSALPLANGSLDTHYQLIASDGPGVVPGPATTYYNQAYIADDADSRWISVGANGTPGFDTTTYRLTFSLASYDFTTAAVSGLVGVDNELEIFLNGVTTGFRLTGDTPGVVDNGDYASFQSLHAFSITSGFVAGDNHLDFVVLDTGPPTALRVDNLAGSARGAVPEPASWALMIAGFGGAGVALRRRRAIAA